MTARKFTMPGSLNESLAASQRPDSGPDNSPANTMNSFSKSAQHPMSSDKPKISSGITFAAEDKLPKLPIPDLESSCKKYLQALKPLQTPREHADTKAAVDEFLRSEGPELQEKLKKYATGKTSYIEQFCELTLEPSVGCGCRNGRRGSRLLELDTVADLTQGTTPI